MSFKIVKIGNALVVTDTDTSVDVLDIPTKDVYYDIDELVNNENIRFVQISSTDSMNQRPRTMALSDCIDTGDAAFTVSSFKAFARASLGN